MSLVHDSMFLTFDGEPVPGRTPVASQVLSEPLSKEQRNMAQVAFARFKSDVRLSIAPTVQQYVTLADGTVLKLVSGFGMDRMTVVSMPAKPAPKAQRVVEQWSCEALLAHPFDPTIGYILSFHIPDAAAATLAAHTALLHAEVGLVVEFSLDGDTWIKGDPNIYRRTDPTPGDMHWSDFGVNGAPYVYMDAWVNDWSKSFWFGTTQSLGMTHTKFKVRLRSEWEFDAEGGQTLQGKTYFEVQVEYVGTRAAAVDCPILNPPGSVVMSTPTYLPVYPYDPAGDYPP